MAANEVFVDDSPILDETASRNVVTNLINNPHQIHGFTSDFTACQLVSFKIVHYFNLHEDAIPFKQFKFEKGKPTVFISLFKFV